MGLLDKLWDDIVAGPRPDSGLGKLRNKPKNPSIREVVVPKLVVDVGGGEYICSKVAQEKFNDVEPRVTRSIMIRRPSQQASTEGTPPPSPAGSTPPVSPFAAAATGGVREWQRVRRKSMSDAYERREATGIGASTSRSSAPPHEV